MDKETLYGLKTETCQKPSNKENYLKRKKIKNTYHESFIHSFILPLYQKIIICI